MYQLAIFLTFVVTLTVFPAVTALAQPMQKGEKYVHSNFFINIYTLFLKYHIPFSYQICDSKIYKILTTGDTKSVWEETYFIPVCCFVLFNFGDYIGKELATRLQWPKPNKTGQLIVLSMSIVRIVFIPLFMYCNVAPSNRSTEVYKFCTTHTLDPLK